MYKAGADQEACGFVSCDRLIISLYELHDLVVQVIDCLLGRRSGKVQTDPFFDIEYVQGEL